MSVGNLIVGIQTKLEEFKKGMSDATGGLDGLSKKVESNKASIALIGGAFTAAGAAVTGALALMVKAAGDEEMTFRHLQTQVELTGNSWKTSKPHIDSFIASMQKMTIYGDTDTAQVLQKLLIYTDDIDKAMMGSKLSMDMAASGLFDVNTAARYVGMAMSGSVEILGRYISELKSSNNEALASMSASEKAAYAIEILQKKFGGAAENELNTFNGRMIQLKNYTGDLVEEIGYQLLPFLTKVVVKITDLTSGVIAFMKEHPTLINNLTVAATAFGLIATAIGGLGAILSVAGPVGIALTGASVLIYNIYKNWDVVTAGFKALYDTVLKPVLDNVNMLFVSVGEVLESIWDILTPLIDGFIEGFDSVWSVVETVFTSVYNFVAGENGVIGKMYEAFRWFLNKLGIELPEASELFGDIKLAGEDAASGVKAKWQDMKNSFADNMEKNKKSHTDEIALLETNESKFTASLNNEETIRIGNKKIAAEFWSERHREFVTDMIADEDAQREAQKTADLEAWDKQFADIEKKYGKMLTAEEVAYAETLAMQGKDWETWAMMVTTPTRWEKMWSDVYTNFSARLSDMGNAWMKAFYEGDFKNGIDFAGKYLVSTFESAFLDIGGSILQAFVDKIKNKIVETLTSSKITETIGGIFGGGGGIGGAVSGVGGLIGSAGGALAGVAAVAAPIAAAAAIGVGAYYAGMAIAKSLEYEHTSQKERSLKAASLETNLAAKYAGIVAAQSDVATWTAANARLMNETRYWAEKTDIGADEASTRAYNSIRNQMINDLKIDTAQSESIASIAKEAILLYRSGELAEIDKNNTIQGFHAGGIISGILGQEKMIKALAGEEVITRQDPRHSLNFGGGINVNITGNNINSELNMTRLAKLAGEEIMKTLKYQVQYAR